MEQSSELSLDTVYVPTIKVQNLSIYVTALKGIASAMQKSLLESYNPICRTEKKRHRFIEQSFRLWEKARVGWFKRTALKHVYYLG